MNQLTITLPELPYAVEEAMNQHQVLWKEHKKDITDQLSAK